MRHACPLVAAAHGRGAPSASGCALVELKGCLGQAQRTCYTPLVLPLPLSVLQAGTSPAAGLPTARTSPQFAPPSSCQQASAHWWGWGWGPEGAAVCGGWPAAWPY